MKIKDNIQLSYEMIPAEDNNEMLPVAPVTLEVHYSFESSDPDAIEIDQVVMTRFPFEEDVTYMFSDQNFDDLATRIRNG